MKTVRYLNSVLTVLAVLLTLNLYMQLAGAPAGSLPGTSVAQANNEPRGVGSQAARQQAIVDELKALNATVRQLQASLADGSIRVKVDALPDSD